MGRLDWLNVYLDMSPAEWAVHQAAASVDPWGEHRDDTRAALNSIAVMSAFVTLGEESALEKLRLLTGYSEPKAEAQRDELSGQDVKRLMGG